MAVPARVGYERAMTTQPTATPPLSLEETLKATLVPPKLYIAYRARKELRRGEREVALLPHLVDPRRAAVDVGANKGVYSWFLARLCPKVYAFEPNPKLFRVLDRGAAANVACSQVALSNRTGTAELRIPLGHRGKPSNQAASLSTAKPATGYLPVAVPTVRLDELGLTGIGFIKIDVEGFEFEVLDGARDILARERPNLLIEMEEKHHPGRALPEMLGEVEALGYCGLFLRRGQLRRIAELDLAAEVRQPASKADYVFNFIFVPR
jgi:FkbM family methyltransferase